MKKYFYNTFLGCLGYKKPQEKNIFEAIDNNNLEDLESILSVEQEKLKEILEKENPPYGTPIFYAIKKGNIKALDKIIKHYPLVLGQEHPSHEKPIFYAIAEGNLEALNAIINCDPEYILEQEHRTYDKPIFYAIAEGNLEVLNAIINRDPKYILEQEDPTYGKPIFYAIAKGNIKALDKIIEHHPLALGQENPSYGTQIFYAIKKGNLEAINCIIEKKPSVLQELDYDKNLNPFEFAIKTHIKNLNSTNPDDNEIAKSLEILNFIYKKQSKAQHDLSEEQLKLLMDYYIEKSHIKLSYNKTDDDYGLLQGYNVMLYKNLLQGINNGQENLDQSQSNPFLSSALKTLDSIDNFDKPIEVGDEKLYIFNAQLNGHCAYFIFHVNDNKLTHISYCDGNDVSTKDLLPQDPQYLKGGVRKFNIKTPIDFNQEFVDEFLKENSADVEMNVFYKKLRDQGLKLPSTSESQEFLTEPDEYLIPTKKQMKGNCPSKAPTIVLRYMHQLKNPNMAEGRMAEGRLDTESQDAESQHANPIYKEFKAQITISAVERLKMSKEKLQKGGFGQEFIDYFIPQVNQILKEVSENADLKIAKDKSTEYSQLHDKIKSSAKSPVDSRFAEVPKPSGEPKPVEGSRPLMPFTIKKMSN